MGSDIQSKEVIDKISDELKVQPAMSIPRELADKIQLVYGVNPNRLVRVVSANIVDTATSTITTTSAEKDTFLIGLDLSVSKSVLSTSVFSRIAVTLFGGATIVMLRINYEPVTAGEHNKTIILPSPIKLQRNTAITITNSTAIASLDVNSAVFFYETDPQ